MGRNRAGYMKEYMRRRRASLPTDICRTCTVRPRRPDRQTCEFCGENSVLSKAALRRQRSDAGLCPECGEVETERTPHGNTRRCDACRETFNIKQAARRERKLTA